MSEAVETSDDRVVLIGPNPLAAAGLEALLAAQGIHVHVRNQDCLDGIAELEPRLILFDGDALGDELPKRWAQAAAQAPWSSGLVIRTNPARAEPDLLPTIHVHKGASHELALTLSRMAAGILRVPLSACRPSPVGASPGLTPRQQQIVSCLALGLTHKQIAARLNISINTVRSHLRQVQARTGVPARAASSLLAG